MVGLGVRKIKDRYNTRIPTQGLDLLDIKEGDMISIEYDRGAVIVKKFKEASI
jgi:bifunctional DNA-binding transcriptional regulator/antitoxin component of YhaV-PrlF toxin-antitoxin module